MLSALAAVVLQGAVVPDTLTLERALDLAFRERGRMVAAKAGVDRARAEARLGTAIPNPVVKFETGAEAPTTTLEVTQPLSWLASSSSIRAAGNASIRSARADSLRARFELEGEVVAAFYRLLGSTEMSRLAAQQARAADTLVQLTERRVSLGDLSELDRDQAAQEAAYLRILEARASEEALVSRMVLERAIGASLPDATVLAGALTQPVPDTIAAAPLTVREVSTPTVVAAREDSAAAAARLQAARLRQLPVPSIIGKWEWGGPPNTPGNTIVGLSLPFPLWHVGQHDVALARAVAVEQSALTLEARLEAVKQVQEARARLRSARVRAQEATNALFPTAQRVRAGAVRLFETGRTGIFPVFDAFRREREAAIIMVEELLAMHTAAATLRSLTGPVR